jgi:predicted RNA binding protein YcfA (HicA-like mRNA interferase family)
VRWPATKARRVFAALQRIGWRLKRTVKRKGGSHRVLERAGRRDYTFAFHDGDEIGPPMLARMGRDTGLKPEDL